jgi:hypothetical protein
MKREEILALCASNPEAIVAYVESLESQIKELSERLQSLEARLNQNSRNSSKPPSTDFSVKKKPVLVQKILIFKLNFSFTLKNMKKQNISQITSRFRQLFGLVVASVSCTEK